jgi:hypothetical protein
VAMVEALAKTISFGPIVITHRDIDRATK